MTDTMKWLVDQITELQEKLGTMESETSPVISTAVVTHVSNTLPIPNTFVKWRDTYDSFSCNMLNPHIPSAATIDPTVNTTQATQNLSFISWESFGKDNMDRLLAMTGWQNAS